MVLINIVIQVRNGSLVHKLNSNNEFHFMQTVDRAMQLLSLFTIEVPERGLSELARVAGFDKATTRRLLVSLQKHDFIEQHTESKKYRLGAGFLHLSRIRETSFPIEKVAQPILEELTTETGETTHISIVSGNSMATVGISPSPRANRVHVDKNELLPIHATASGLIFLAFAPKLRYDKIISSPLKSYASNTITDEVELKLIVEKARKCGFGLAEHSFEDDVVSVAGPVFDADGYACGAVGVASPASRIDKERVRHYGKLAINAGMKITRSIGGRYIIANGER